MSNSVVNWNNLNIHRFYYRILLESQVPIAIVYVVAIATLYIVVTAIFFLVFVFFSELPE